MQSAASLHTPHPSPVFIVLISGSVLAAGLLAVALCRALFAKWREWTSVHYREVQRHKRLMADAPNYEAWAAACSKVEKLQGVDGPTGLGRWERETRLYDRKLLEERVRHLQAVKLDGDVHEMMFAVRADLLRNLGNMCNRFASPLQQAPARK